jgi:hypothetical protein
MLPLSVLAVFFSATQIRSAGWYLLMRLERNAAPGLPEILKIRYPKGER